MDEKYLFTVPRSPIFGWKMLIKLIKHPAKWWWNHQSTGAFWMVQIFSMVPPENTQKCWICCYFHGSNCYFQGIYHGIQGSTPMKSATSSAFSPRFPRFSLLAPPATRCHRLWHRPPRLPRGAAGMSVARARAAARTATTAAPDVTRWSWKISWSI